VPKENGRGMKSKIILKFESEGEYFSSWDLMSLHLDAKDEVLTIKDWEGISERTIDLHLVNIEKFKLTVERDY